MITYAEVARSPVCRSVLKTPVREARIIAGSTAHGPRDSVQPDPGPEWVTVAEAAERIGAGLGIVSSMCKRDVLPSVLTRRPTGVYKRNLVVRVIPLASIGPVAERYRRRQELLAQRKDAQARTTTETPAPSAPAPPIRRDEHGRVVVFLSDLPADLKAMVPVFGRATVCSIWAEMLEEHGWELCNTDRKQAQTAQIMEGL